MRKPIVYIASPYSRGDVALNTHFQCRIFDELLGDGLVLPVAPLWTHFQHLLFPRPYEEWINYDQALLHLYDCCLRLDVDIPERAYRQHDSKGADAEVASFERMGKPVFYSKQTLYEWVRETFRG